MVNRNEMISYHYLFAFGDGTKKEFDIKLDPVTLDCMQTERKTTPEWTRLEYSRCDNCPLDSSKFEFCPIAVTLAELVDSFKDMISYEDVDVMLTTKERNTWKHTSVQDGVSPLLGIYMVTSGCPIMEKLKPMVRYHLPFASVEETAYRATCMYLLGQYFRNKKGMEPDWEFRGLTEIYENIKVVNKGMCERLRNASNQDANVNAIVHLDVFAQVLPYSMKDVLGKMEYLFDAYMK